MAQRYGTTTEVSVQHLDELFPIITRNTEHDIRRYLEERGYAIIGVFSHEKTVRTRTNETTGSVDEIGVIYSSVGFQ